MKINHKLGLAFALVLIGFSFLLLIFENLFIERYYQYKSKYQLEEKYQEICDYFASDSYSDSEYLIRLNEMTMDSKIMLFYFNKYGIRESLLGQIRSPEITTLRSLGLRYEDGTLVTDYLNTISPEGITITFDENKTSDIKNTGILGRIIVDDETKGFVFLYTSFTIIQENTRIFNLFTLYITIILLLISAIVSTILSNELAKPLKKIEEKTKRISNLDFSGDKLEIKSKDEIGSLSSSINKMSFELEKSINELKEANLKLEEDIKLKEKVNKLKEEFISDVSHELKTPISIIGGYSEALKLEGLSQDDINNYADIIIDESKRMNKMVRDLLKFTQIESGFISLDKEDFRILDLINEAIKPHELRIKEKKINLKVDVLDALVNGDYDMMETVFNNLLSNAMNYVDNETREIKIESELLNDKLRIYVYNSGDSISKENMDRLFESFYRVDKSRSRKYGGSGLGLSIVKSIMDAYQNKFGVENIDKGVRFYFDINYVRREE